MKKVSKKDMAFLEKLMADFNDYSELVALNYEQKKEKPEFDEGILQWNRGHLYCVDELLKDFADSCRVKLVFTCGTHPFLERELEYRTVHLKGEDTTYHRTKCSDIPVR